MKEMKKIRNVTDYNGEFGYELALVLPYAYYLHKNGNLLKTISSKHTACLYYFSNNHEEKYDKRKFVIPRGVPNKVLHVKHLDYSKWIPPPLKDIYKNNYFTYEKKICIIHNKFNQEWRGKPVNYIDIITLEKIFNLLHKKYFIVYLRPKNIIRDDCEIYSLNGEEDLLTKYNIKTGTSLYNETKTKYNIKDMNHFQLLLHSNCSNFISVQGGSSYLASYFGGINIIFAKKGGELSNNSYDGFFKRFSNCDIHHTNSYSSLLNMITDFF